MFFPICISKSIPDSLYKRFGIHVCMEEVSESRTSTRGTGSTSLSISPYVSLSPLTQISFLPNEDSLIFTWPNKDTSLIQFYCFHTIPHQVAFSFPMRMLFSIGLVKRCIFKNTNFNLMLRYIGFNHPKYHRNDRNDWINL